jgi:hypothetical protein
MYEKLLHTFSYAESSKKGFCIAFVDSEELTDSTESDALGLGMVEDSFEATGGAGTKSGLALRRSSICFLEVAILSTICSWIDLNI